MKHRYLPALCVTLILAVAGSSMASQEAKTSSKAGGKKAQNFRAAVSQGECAQWAKSNAAQSMKMDMDEHAKRGMYMLTPPGNPLPLVCLVLPDPFHPPLYEHIGTATRTVPGSENTQRYFNQGLQFFYAFNNRESYRAFRYAAYLASLRLRHERLSCAWCYVGEALALSPDINWGRENELDRGVAIRALDDADKALQTDLDRHEITKEEHDKVDLIIQALKSRFADPPKSLPENCDCQSTKSKCTSVQDWRNYNYQQAIAAPFDKYQDDPDYVVLFADAVMNQIPWGYWKDDGSPKCSAIGQAQTAIETALKRSPTDKPLHNGLVHWYIHLMEMSGTPEAAEPYARKLAGLAPNAGHLVHMPAHIYYRIGDMPSSIDTNSKAVATDRNYLCLNGIENCKERLKHPDGDRYRFGYYPHNIHFELASAVLTGRADVVARASETLLASAPAKPDAYRADRYLAVYYLTKLNYSTIREIQSFPKPADVQLFSGVAYEYAQVFADVLGQNSKSAENNYLKLQDAAKAYRDNATGGNLQCDPKQDRPGDINLCVVQLMLDVARARIDTIEPDKPASKVFDCMKEAITIQDIFPYGEPPQWLYPVRQTLAGLILLKSNSPDDLSKAMGQLKESLPEILPLGRPIGSGVFPGNAWAYFGLWKLALKLRLPDEAKRYENKFRQLWKGKSEPEFLRM